MHFENTKNPSCADLFTISSLIKSWIWQCLGRPNSFFTTTCNKLRCTS
uniref:Uncharacterized protein n=1 Tax=Arundo donax TaxID=35708 RepID=A0A0A8Z4X6_ARUDO